MTDHHEQMVRGFLDALHVSDPDFAVLTEGLLAEDARYVPLLPLRAPVRGRAAIRTELERQYDFYTECRCDIIALASDDRFVFTERVDRVTLRGDGREVVVRVCGVFEFDDRGLVTSWREYYDSADMAEQLGLTPQEFADHMRSYARPR